MKYKIIFKTKVVDFNNAYNKAVRFADGCFDYDFQEESYIRTTGELSVTVEAQPTKEIVEVLRTNLQTVLKEEWEKKDVKLLGFTYDRIELLLGG